MCGEQLRRLMPPSAYQEPSPRVRGAGRGPLDQAWFAGIIPRVCGEQFHLTDTGKALMGSSPRVRGAARGQCPDGRHHGIIPARAGSSFRSGWPNWCSRDHPRACGEQVPGLSSVDGTGGSSPRVRGAVCRCVCGICRVGIIPARAGSSTDRCAATSWRRDHPRACGEQKLATVKVFGRWGSSPRVRGAAERRRPGEAGRGIIPARAGSSATSLEVSLAPRDHPRASGEQENVIRKLTSRKGSSPRVRGAVPQKRWRVFRTGIIPARAGSSHWSGLIRRTAKDHPRACGEQPFRHAPVRCGPQFNPRSMW